MSRNFELVVLINARSGAGTSADVVTRLKDIFAAANIAVTISVLSSGDRIDAAARRALDNNPRAIVAGGGDGTVNAVASALVGTDTPLGVLPLGTLNHFAKAIGIPTTIEEAASVVIAGRAQQVDVGEVNGRVFLNNSSLGLYPRIVRLRQQQQELGHGKWPSFAWALVTLLRRHRFLHLQLEVDGTTVSRRTPVVFVGNNKYHLEGLQLGQRDRLDGGKLSLCILRGAGRLGLLRLAVDALLHRLSKGQGLEAMMIKECVIESHHRTLEVAIDGEVEWLVTPLRYCVRPLALNVLA